MRCGVKFTVTLAPAATPISCSISGAVPMRTHRIGRKSLACFAEQRVLLQAAARAGNAGFGVDDDVVHVDQFGFGERNQRQQRRGRIAAGTRHEPGCRYLLPIKLGEPVNGFTLKAGCAVLVAVPLRVYAHVAKPEIRRHVEDLDRRIGGNDGRGDLLRGAVRQPAEHGIETGPVDLFPFHKPRQVEHEEMRKNLVHRLASMGICGERRYLDARMPRQQPHRVGAGVTGRADNADLLSRAHDTVPSGIALSFNCVVWTSNSCSRNARMLRASCCASTSACKASALATAA